MSISFSSSHRAFFGARTRIIRAPALQKRTGTGGLYLHGVHAGKLEEEAMRHGEFLGKIAPHFAEVRAKAIALGVNPNGDGIVHNDLQQFLDDIPDWLREFYEELPAEAQRALRSQYVSVAGKKYWSGDVDEETRVLGQYLAAGVKDEATFVAMRGRMLQVAAAFHEDPVVALAMIGDGVEVAGECNEECEQIATILRNEILATEPQLVASGDTGIVTDAGSGGAEKSLVVRIGERMIPSIISGVSRVVDGLQRLNLNYIDSALAITRTARAIVQLSSHHADPALAQEFAVTMTKTIAEKLWGEAKELTNRAKEEILAEANRVMDTMVREAIREEKFNEEIKEGIMKFVEKYVWEEIYPLFAAKWASSPEERHNILIQGGFMEHSPATDPAHAGKLVVTVNGHWQTLHENPEIVGMNDATLNLTEKGYEVLHFRVGSATGEATQMIGLAHSPTLMRDLTLKIVDDRLRKQGIFQTEPNVVTIGLMGYSWGGGTVIDVADHLEFAPENATWRDIPVHMAIIDAVEIGSANCAYPAGYDETASYRPGNVNSLFNRYQTHASPSQEEILNDMGSLQIGVSAPGIDPVLLARTVYGVFTSGNPAHGRGYGEREGDDQESLGLVSDHFLIDNENQNDYVNGQKQNELLIDKAKTFIEERLSPQ